jgi:hypothetical protein
VNRSTGPLCHDVRATDVAPLNDVQRAALAVALGSASRVATAQRVLDSIRTATRDAWIKGRYFDHLVALEQIGLVEFEPGLFTRQGNVRYRARPIGPIATRSV